MSIQNDKKFPITVMLSAEQKQKYDNGLMFSIMVQKPKNVFEYFKGKKQQLKDEG